MRHFATAAALACGLILSFAPSLRAEITAEQVRKAIDHGVAYLKRQQHPNGSWADRAFGIVPEPGGISALCALALLSAGVGPDDPAMENALQYLRKIDTEETYVLSLQTMVLARAEPDKDRLLIRRNVARLQKHQIESGDCAGAWNYGEAGKGDNSNSQFALLALHEAERVGVPTSLGTWRRAYAYWQKCQNGDGSWGYMLQGQADAGGPASYPSGPGTGSMTCAGITSLVIAADRVRPSEAKAEGDRITCCLPHETDDSDRIQKAMEWLGSHHSVSQNPGIGATWWLYYLYGLERAGRLTARRFLPLPPRAGQSRRADWYREGTERLVREGTQDGLSGYWVGTGVESEPLIGTSFALLFLSKGRWPVLMAKLQYGDGNDWDHHRSDVANMTRYVESRWRRDLTWQVVDLEQATVEDLIQTPVLYFCGSQDPLPEEPRRRKEMAQKLRDYIDRGGFLFAEGYCGGEGFDSGFRELMRLVFPEPEYKLRLLEREHPIWYAEEKISPEQVRPVWGIESGCRTSVVYVPPDPPRDPRASLSCLWELSRPGRGENYSSAVQAQIDAALSLGLNVLAYATNRELSGKEMFFDTSAAKHSDDRVEHGRLVVATLNHPGGCHTAPRALAVLMDTAARQLKGGPHFRPHAREELLNITDDALFQCHLVFMHGRTAFHLTAAERRQLKLYIERGGMLMADSICASQAFTDSFRTEMAAIFSDHKLEPIPVSDPMLGTTYGGFDLRTVSRRDPQAAPAGGGPLEAMTRQVPPELEGIKFGDRWGVVFSPFDISCALEKHDSLECRGYTREDAARIGLNVLAYSLLQ